MRFRRLTLVANVVIIGATVPVVGLPLAAPSGAASPMYEYVNAGPTTWSTDALTGPLGGHRVLGNVHAAAGDGEYALAARIDNGDLGLYVRNANGTSSFRDITSLTGAPAAGADPNVFVDPWGNVGLIYVSTHDHLVMVTTKPARAARRSHAIVASSLSGFAVTNLTNLTHVSMSPSVPSLSLSGVSALVVDRSAAGDAIALPLRWSQSNLAPQVGVASDVSTLTNSPAIANDPVTFSTMTNAFAATTNAGHIEFFSQNAANSWSMTDLTTLDASPASTGQIAGATNGVQLDLAGLSGIGQVEFFSITAANLAHMRTHATGHATTPSTTTTTTTTTPAPTTWVFSNLTTLITGSPAWEGQIYLSATPTSINVAGRAANWGDLYDYTATLPNLTWTSSDVSLDASAANSIASGVTGVMDGSTLRLFAASDGAISHGGVGVYAIPSQDWGRAISDGWPIISETGGLGTMSAPWVGFTSAPSVTQSPDFLMGQNITNANKRETWLSFWTVSGPLTPATQTPSSYYSHGFLSGQWVAQQIDQYHLHGVNLKPNWVILDPEGYPDNHSALAAPAGASPAVLATYASYWSAMLAGWSTGLTTVDPTLHPGVYAEQSEYRNYGLANTSLPVFEAIAFGGGGPVRIAGSNGPNILGYIAFNGACTPTSTLRAQEQTLVNPPWSGRYNTLQFNAGVYCAP